MSELNNLNKPAQAHTEWSAVERKDIYETHNGLTIRQHAAITMRVPMSGDQELDEMIREARRLDMAAKAMQGFAANGYDINFGEKFAEIAYKDADALLAAIASVERPASECGEHCKKCGCVGCSGKCSPGEGLMHAA